MQTYGFKSLLCQFWQGLQSWTVILKPDFSMISLSEGLTGSAVTEIQLLLHNLYRRQHGQPAKPQKHHQMVRNSELNSLIKTFASAT